MEVLGRQLDKRYELGEEFRIRSEELVFDGERQARPRQTNASHSLLHVDPHFVSLSLCFELGSQETQKGPWQMGQNFSKSFRIQVRHEAGKRKSGGVYRWGRG